MKVFSIIGKQKLRENIAPQIIGALEDEGYSVGFIKKTDNISSNSRTKRAIIWGEHQYLFYHEHKSSLEDLLSLFDEDYVIVDNDEMSEVPKLLMYEEANLENTGNVDELGLMNKLKRREDLFFTADMDTDFEEIKQAILDNIEEYNLTTAEEEPEAFEESMIETEPMISTNVKSLLMDDDTKSYTIGEVEETIILQVGDEDVEMEAFAKAVLKNSVEGIAKELDGYDEESDIRVHIKK
jgi:hypothetical protein